QYMRYEGDESDVGKYNGGQKLLFWSVSLAALAMAATGLVLWFPATFPQLVRERSILLHDATFILLAVAIVCDVYLGTVASPGRAPRPPACGPSRVRPRSRGPSSPRDPPLRRASRAARARRRSALPLCRGRGDGADAPRGLLERRQYGGRGLPLARHAASLR